MTSKLIQLICLLSDGHYHSGSALGQHLGLTRAGVWKLIQQFDKFHLPILKKTNKGYQIPGGLELLNSEAIYNTLSVSLASRVDLTITQLISSTQDYLLSSPSSLSKKLSVCIAESQTKGRGRFNHEWYSPYGKNIYLSLQWPFSKSPNELSGLSLALALAVVRALKRLDYLPPSLKLKWPNDIFCDRKMGGILIEVQGELNGNCWLIIGVGLNLSLPPQALNTIKTPWTDLEQVLNKKVSRNLLVATLIEEMVNILEDFERTGFAPFKEAWMAYDLSLGQSVQILHGNTFYHGKGCGIDDNGSFLLEDSQTKKITAYSSGEVSLFLNPKSQ